MGIRMYVRKVSCGKDEVRIDWDGYQMKHGNKFGWYQIENGMLIDTQQQNSRGKPLTNDFFEFVHYFNDMFPQGIYELEPEFMKLSEFVSGYCQVTYKADGRDFFGGLASVTIKVGKKARKGARKASPKRRSSARKSARKASPKRRSSARKSARRSSARRSARKASPKRRSSARKSVRKASPKKKMSVADLKKLCKEKGIKGYSTT